MKRVVTAVVLAIFAVWCIFYAPQPAFLAFAVALACLCYHEYSTIAAASGVEGPLAVGFATGLIAMYRPDSVPVLAVVVMIAALRSRDLRNALSFSGTVVLGIVYIFLAWRWAADLRAVNTGWLFYALSINWAGDIAAYYGGRTFGRHKLAPRVSPGKSWEGAISSVLVCIGYGIWLRQQFQLQIDLPMMVGLTIVANIAGQLGDLAESALKRGAGMKDSGTLLPGHGGFLDRLDSSLFTLPVVYHFLRWTGAA